MNNFSEMLSKAKDIQKAFPDAKLVDLTEEE